MRFADWHLTPQRVAIHLPTATAVIADLHLGYHHARRHGGDAIPNVDMNDELAPLLTALAQGQAKNLMVAGDLFEKGFDPTTWHEFKSRLAITNVHFLGLVPGNHDRRLDDAPPDLPILKNGHVLGTWTIHHGDGPLPKTPTVLGHFHPAVPYHGRKVPCYLMTNGRLILPAYSQDSAGTNVSKMTDRNSYQCVAIVNEKQLASVKPTSALRSPFVFRHLPRITRR
jgi:metallophosphoesterase superfamily enzyme